MKRVFVLLLMGAVVWSIYAWPSPRLSANRAAGSEAVEVHIEPEEGLNWLTEQIDSAERSVKVVMYQFSDQSLAGHLIRAAKRGVHVEVLMNNGYRGSGAPDNASAYTYLANGGVAVKWTPGCYDLTHEKSVLIDDRILDVMTLNLTPKYYASGREFAVVDRLGSDLAAADEAFTTDWMGGCGLPHQASRLVWSPGASQATLELIHSARRSIDSYNEEMADPQVTAALEEAAKRGVQVRVCMTYQTAWKTAFQELVAKGIEVRTYTKSGPLYIHAKMILVDGQRGFVGSQNFSPPSLESNRELGIIFSDPAPLASLTSIFASDFAQARIYEWK